MWTWSSMLHYLLQNAPLHDIPGKKAWVSKNAAYFFLPLTPAPQWRKWSKAPPPLQKVCHSSSNLKGEKRARNLLPSHAIRSALPCYENKCVSEWAEWRVCHMVHSETFPFWVVMNREGPKRAQFRAVLHSFCNGCTLLKISPWGVIASPLRRT